MRARGAGTRAFSDTPLPIGSIARLCPWTYLDDCLLAGDFEDLALPDLAVAQLDVDDLGISTEADERTNR